MVLTGNLAIRKLLSWVTLGWMKLSSYPLLSGILNERFFAAFVIQIQTVTGSASGWSGANNLQGICRPHKMLCPCLLAWIEQRSFCSCFWIDSCCEVIASFITATTSKREVVQVITAAKGLRLKRLFICCTCNPLGIRVDGLSNVVMACFGI